MTQLTPDMRRTLPSAVQKRIKRENERDYMLRNPHTEKPASAFRRMLQAMHDGTPWTALARDVNAGARLWMEKRARKRTSRYIAKGGIKR